MICLLFAMIGINFLPIIENNQTDPYSYLGKY